MRASMDSEKSFKVSDRIYQKYLVILNDYFLKITQNLEVKEFDVNCFKEFSVIGHKLAGSGGLYGFPEFVELGEKLEKFSNVQDEINSRAVANLILCEIKNILKLNQKI